MQNQSHTPKVAMNKVTYNNGKRYRPSPEWMVSRQQLIYDAS